MTKRNRAKYRRRADTIGQGPRVAPTALRSFSLLTDALPSLGGDRAPGVVRSPAATTPRQESPYEEDGDRAA